MCDSLSQWLIRIGDPQQDPFPNGQVYDCPVSDDPGLSINPWHRFIANQAKSPNRDECIANERVRFKGKSDFVGCFQGLGQISRDNGDELTGYFVDGIPTGDVVISSPEKDISRLVGCYENGFLQGKATLVTCDTTVFECFLKDDVPHGAVRRIHMKKFREFRRQITFIGHYRNGVPFGPSWEYREGGGFVFGEPDHRGDFSGDQIAYLYPDLETAWFGKFREGIMENAIPARVTSWSLENEIAVPKFEVSSNSQPVKYCKSTKSAMGEGLLIEDPYEKIWIDCRNSSISDAGEGVFARRDIPKGTIVAFYNGVRLPFVLGGPKEDWSTSGYKIFVNADFKSGERMDIPEKYIPIDAYCASLGHKVNHSFEPNCTEWFIEHPRFGVIPCERTLKHIRAGEELYLDYEYDPYNCPEWFSDALRLFVKTAGDEQLERINVRYSKFIQNEIQS